MVKNDLNPTYEQTLGNGLKLLLREDHTAPICSVWTWYRVGSRNELPGKTGLSHWVEHMQFKGTPTLTKGQIFRDVSRVGGTLNALTSQDWTAYFETVPKDKIDLALRIEADRMVNSLFTPEEVESERTVILSERHGSENNPGFALYEEVVGAAFQAHPYRHMVIGHEADLHAITRDDLYEHYRRYYQPHNAFVVAVGDFDAPGLAAEIDAAFKAVTPGSVAPNPVQVVEPTPRGERRVRLEMPSGVPYFRVAFHAPAARSAGLAPLLVMEAILSGGQPMGFGGGGAMGRSSRLYRSLVASGIARSAASDMSITVDPFLFQIGVTGLPDSDLARVEEIVTENLDRLRLEPVADEELSRALRQIEAQYVYSSEGITSQAYWLGHWEIVDKWSRAETFLEEVGAVTAEDVQRVANEVLRADRRTVGWLVPSRTGSAAEDGGATAVFVVPHSWGVDGSTATSRSEPGAFERTTLSNGIVLLGQDRPTSRSVVLRARLPAGSIHDTRPGIGYLTGRSTLRGSAGRTYEEISDLTDQLGSSISIDVGREFVEARVRCLRDDLPVMTELLAQTLFSPDFPDEEVERVKAEQLAAIAEADYDTRATADRLMRRAVYPVPNPLGRRVLGEKDLVDGMSAADVRAHHSEAFAPDAMTIAIVGGISGFDRAVGQLEQAFHHWQPRGARKVRPDLARTSDAGLRIEESIPGKTQSDIAAGVATISRLHPDFYALDLANLVLGRLGLMGRLGAEVRDRAGLAYYVFSQLEPRTDGSLWSVRAGVAPENVERAIEAITRELTRLRTEPLDIDEIRDAKSYLIGVLPLALESHDGVAATLLAIEEYGLGLDYLQRYPGIIAAVTSEDVLRAAHEQLPHDQIVIAVAQPNRAVTTA